MQRRRFFPQALAAGVVGGLAITACGGGGDGSDDDQVALRYEWWGSDTRYQLTEELVELFEEEHPNITIDHGYTEFDDYWDQLAVRTAGGDAPDVMMQEERFLREYAERDTLADLNDYDIDTSQIEDSLLESGEFNDGLWGIPTGANIYSIMVDPQIFDDAGVEIPDDRTWTWEDYRETMLAVAENTPDGVYGTGEFGFIEGPLNVWLRQNGQNMWTEDGEIGFDEELLAELWEHHLELIETGAAPPAGVANERMGPEESLLATNEAAIDTFWSNQLHTLSNASGRDIELLRFPGEQEFERTGIYLKPAMAISMSAETDHPEEAAIFIDWMLNSPEAGEIILSDRGLAANTEVRDHVEEHFDEADQITAEFLDEVEDEILDAPPTPPIGAGAVTDLLERLNDEVLFGRMTPQEAAAQFMDEVEEIIG
ncbi:ABC transporter substrate-binding protein [Nesterenkonia alba]|uniref:ABC transporter substrate-binding protein n=1 Tax=Nesterenkonia alba TaxID=515814 RepID=UPI0003B66E46|nr:extracellular solute-binding protein [Nesterenkonia alba]